MLIEQHSMLLWNAALKPVADVQKEESLKMALSLINTRSKSFTAPIIGNAPKGMWLIAMEQPSSISVVRQEVQRRLSFSVSKSGSPMS